MVASPDSAVGGMGEAEAAGLHPAVGSAGEAKAVGLDPVVARPYPSGRSGDGHPGGEHRAVATTEDGLGGCIRGFSFFIILVRLTEVDSRTASVAHD